MNFVLKGNICFSKTPEELETQANGYVICEDGLSKGVFQEIPAEYRALPVTDYGDAVIIPGLCDLHTHAPQYPNRGLGIGMELLDWLEKYTFPEESRYGDIGYAGKAYGVFSDVLRRSATTRACIFATIHAEATTLLMEKLERTGLVTMVGKVNMDRNCPDNIREQDAQSAYESTKSWIESATCRFVNTKPILTPRFIPTCTDELMLKIRELQEGYGLPVQSHLSENLSEVEWVRKLCPGDASYGDAYNRYGLFGGNGIPTIMAHCVWSEGAEEDLLRDNSVYVAHCPQSNVNLSSGIAPVRRFISKGIRVGLGSDIAGGCHLSIFRAMSDAVRVSKMYWRLVDQDAAPLSAQEAFYLGTAGGGSFFGKVGSFEEGYEFDAVVLDDSGIIPGSSFSVKERVERIIHLSEDVRISGKYVRGKKVLNY